MYNMNTYNVVKTIESAVPRPHLNLYTLSFPFPRCPLGQEPVLAKTVFSSNFVENFEFSRERQIRTITKDWGTTTHTINDRRTK